MWDGEADPVTITPEEVNAPFDESSAAVIAAAMQGAEITQLGTETVGNQPADHYRIRLGDEGVNALAALPANQLSAFELEYARGITNVDVWVADGLIARIQMEILFNPDLPDETVESVDIQFSDIDADIVITPPT